MKFFLLLLSIFISPAILFAQTNGIQSSICSKKASELQDGFSFGDSYLINQSGSYDYFDGFNYKTIKNAQELGIKFVTKNDLPSPLGFAELVTLDDKLVLIDFSFTLKDSPKQILKQIKAIDKITQIPFSLGGFQQSSDSFRGSVVCADFVAYLQAFRANNFTTIACRLESFDFADKLKIREETRRQEKEAEKLRQEKLDQEIAEIKRQAELRKIPAAATPTPTPLPSATPVITPTSNPKDDAAIVVEDEPKKTPPPVTDLCETSASPIIQGLRLGDSLVVLRKETNLPFASNKPTINGDNQYFIFRNARPNIRLLGLTFYKNQLSKILVVYGDDIQWRDVKDFRDTVSRSLNLPLSKWNAESNYSTNGNYYMFCTNYTLTVGAYRQMQLEAVSIALQRAEKADAEKKKRDFKP